MVRKPVRVSFNWRGRSFAQRVRQAIGEELVIGTEMIKEEAVRLILDTPKSGIFYPRRGILHQASAPGEPPASDTGRLVNSIRTAVDRINLRGRVIVGTAYAAFLEFGTVKMKPRPFMRPALANMLPEIRLNLVRVVERVNTRSRQSRS